MADDVALFIRQCLTCARIKNPPPTHRRTVHRHLDHPAALDLVSLDHVKIMDGDQMRYLLVVVDHATRYLQARWVKGETAAETLSTFNNC